MQREPQRNIALIAHIDHGKSTLADRLLEITETVPPLKMREQFLDRLELERERGVTIKLKPVQIKYKLPHNLRETLNSELLILNLIDTPGHVDFSYEVSRALAACEGAVLIVDAVSGIEAQTFAHTQKARELGLKIIPVINKIDLTAADPEGVAAAVCRTFGFKKEEILFVSAKTGKGITELLKAVALRVPPPTGDSQKPLRALVFDSFYREHQGVVAVVKVVDGVLKSGEKLLFFASGAEGKAGEVGCFSPEMTPKDRLEAGAVGYIATGLKKPDLVRIGDTLTHPQEKEEIQPLPGYREPRAVVFVSFYPLQSDKLAELERALKKLRLEDPAFSFEREGGVLGQGFRCGFLGLFHAEIIQERLERDYKLDIFATQPTVEYSLDSKKIRRPADLPQPRAVVREPWVKATIITPQRYLGTIIQLCEENYGRYLDTNYLSEETVKISYKLPLAALIREESFFDRLKSVSAGFASLDYELAGDEPVEVVRLDILVAGRREEALSQIVRREEAMSRGRKLVKKLKELVPRQQFPVALQAAIGGKIIARETIPALRKDVTAKLYGGDVTRKKKLLKKQKKGKKRLKKIGRIEIPQEIFFQIKSRS